MSDDEARSRGTALQKKMFGADPLAQPKARTAQWSEWGQRVLFGELWSRPQLDLRTRSLVTIAALAIQNKPDQLAAHIRGGLNNGATPDEIIEVLMQMGFYGGWANGASSLAVADKILTELGK
jgi:4-carboxymuconolactone decarboxylase